ncbi:hypothetical protein B8W72_20500 [Pseudomonas putida]|uniref:Uncharacterized protein n=1 Tax=Pseudomonas putida TaxID=303 RepID=A0A1Y3KT17_PSEPU|nr:hypothetical protein B8W72_20500 [Pseudomonas putida]
MLSLPAAWLAELNDQSAFAGRSEGRAEVLAELALSAHRRRDVDAHQSAGKVAHGHSFVGILRSTQGGFGRARQ